MRSGTFCCNWMVAKKNFGRFWPLWAVYAVIWLLVLPGRALLSLRHGPETMASFAQYSVKGAEVGALWMAAGFGAMAAMAMLSHLYSARSANFTGALPARRGGLFLAHYLTGLCSLLGANLLVALLTALAEAAGGELYLTPLAQWLWLACGECLFFYSFAVLVGMLVGHLLALPALYLIFNGLVVAMTNVVDAVLRAYLYGYSGVSSTVAKLVTWLTPVSQLSVTPERYAAVAVYAAVGVVMAAVALLLYRARQLERAGDVVAVKPLRPVFLYGVAVCTGLVLGWITYLMLGSLALWVVLWSVVGYFAGRMLLDKSLKVLRHWKGAVAVAAVLLLFFAALQLDMTGFVTWTPDEDQVASVTLSGLNVGGVYDGANYIDEVEMDDPEVIREVIALHRRAIDQRSGPGEYDRVCTVDVRYTLTSGVEVTRWYQLYYSNDQVDREGTSAWHLQRLMDSRELYWKAYGFDRVEAILAAGGTLDIVVEDRPADTEVDDDYTGQYTGGTEALWAAIKEDFWAGRIGRHGVGYNGSGELGTIDLAAIQRVDGRLVQDCAVNIALDDTATSTLAVLAG